MKVLVTGGEGHIGGAIRNHLASLGWEVITVSRNGIIKADLARHDFVDIVAEALPACDVIVHGAAAMSKALDDVNVSEVNCAGTQRIISAARRLGVHHLIYLSSLPVIGRPVNRPIDEDHAVNPLTAYHASKLYGEYLMKLASSLSLVTTSLRITSPVGPGTPRGRIFSEFALNAHRDLPIVLSGQGGRRQDYIDVRDIARAIELAINAKASGVFNIASGKAISNLELALLCKELLCSSSAITYTGTPDPEEDIAWEVSIDKAKKAFGFEPLCSMEQSIRGFLSTHADRDNQ